LPQRANAVALLPAAMAGPQNCDEMNRKAVHKLLTTPNRDLKILNSLLCSRLLVLLQEAQLYHVAESQY
jgi:hypothetical protein